ncbi:MAG: hypothetical protein IKM30_08225 [Oscillospiraceae bacterium]|nr:hypothetical protein [Oscillospiraceae bacterium]
MGLFGSFQNAGPGIDPNAPKKKPFFRFWEILWRSLGKLFSLNMIHALLHAPLFLSLIVYLETNNALTVPLAIALLILQLILEGPIMAGCARVLRLIVLDKPCFLGDEFKKGFSQNFIPSVLVWLLDTIVIASVVCGFYVYPVLMQQVGSKLVYIPYVISVAVALILLFMNFYLFPMIVATDLKLKSVFKNAFMLSCASPKQCLISFGGSVLMLAIVVVLIMVNSLFMGLVAFFPAAFIGYLVMFVNYPVIQKYVINPYYEQSGEQNPEEDAPISEEERVFTDRGGTETPIKKEKPKKGKTIS